ncbi:DNA repair protein endonuclease SAE2/CtIP C-terminus-domain-containing protein [Amylostereum chailletii]|nr:DNA repair protein endonuclease SAE2/CtIP C-terminus-domain-containing protein [Amylostereum chailletii]
MINPEANHGLDFQFDEVVRKKQHRHALGAGDCEDCRDYYDAIGPMPSRLQPPAWRSPRKSPTHHHHANNTSVDAHKQEISRHRAQWRRPPTPPGYWDIGFPDTQEASKINARAAEMHREKQEMVRQEAQKEGGKFRRKG